ncbi:MAG: lysylphosphatidylglycerol synthase domain-containing protein [Anaeromyxobacter sp.]
MVAATAWGLVGWVAEILIALFALPAVGLPATLAASGLAVIATTAVNIVAVSPGNTGPFELAVVAALGGLGDCPGARAGLRAHLPPGPPGAGGAPGRVGPAARGGAPQPGRRGGAGGGARHQAVIGRS